MDQLLKRQIYISEKTPEFFESDLDNMVARASERNHEDGITGGLIICDDFFFQAIEGDASAIDNLMARLERDKRHKNLRTIYSYVGKDRQFASWHECEFDTEDDEHKSLLNACARSHHVSHAMAEGILLIFKGLCNNTQ